MSILRVDTVQNVAGTPILFGAGQTWQSPTRAANTNYTNSTGRAIMITVYNGASNGTSTITVDGESVGSSSNGVGYEKGISISAVVPNGSTYSVSGPISYWRELR